MQVGVLAGSPFHLQGGVFDAKLMVQQLRQSPAHPIRIGLPVAQHNMGRQYRFLRTQGPDVQIMHGRDVRVRQQGFTDLCQVQSCRHARSNFQVRGRSHNPMSTAMMVSTTVQPVNLISNAPTMTPTDPNMSLHTSR